jgi:methylmalonyl-CoA mutase N-terminal domain/subunit
MEEEAIKYFKRLDAMGGMVAAIEQGYPQREIHRAAAQYQREVDAGERIIVGVNRFTESHEMPIPILKITQSTEDRLVRRLKQRKARRSQRRLSAALTRLTEAATRDEYLMPLIIAAVRAEATVGEICDIFRRVYGEYREGNEF